MKITTIAKFFGILAICALPVLSSCSPTEKIYTEEEIGLSVEVEWARSGWNEVINETSGTVTLITYFPYVISYSPEQHELTTVINPGKTAKFDVGCFIEGTSIDECLKATIVLGDGTQIVCERGDPMNAWSNRFFTNYLTRDDSEIAVVDGKMVRHKLYVRTFHIDNELIDLWRAGSLE